MTTLAQAKQVIHHANRNKNKGGKEDMLFMEFEGVEGSGLGETAGDVGPEKELKKEVEGKFRIWLPPSFEVKRAYDSNRQRLGDMLLSNIDFYFRFDARVADLKTVCQEKAATFHFQKATFFSYVLDGNTYRCEIQDEWKNVLSMQFHILENGLGAWANMYSNKVYFSAKKDSGGSIESHLSTSNRLDS